MGKLLDERIKMLEAEIASQAQTFLQALEVVARAYAVLAAYEQIPEVLEAHPEVLGFKMKLAKFTERAVDTLAENISQKLLVWGLSLEGVQMVKERFENFKKLAVEDILAASP